MRSLLTCFVLTLATCLWAEDPLPPAPAGFAWQRLPEIKSVVLKPDGWFYKQAKKGETEGFFISKEDIEKTGSLKTGLTLNCARDVRKKSGLAPSAYAATLVKAAAAKHKLTDQSTTTQGPFRAVRFRYVDATPPRESHTVHQLLIANDKTGTLFLIIFEAPTKNWDDAWNKGEVILKKLLLDDEV